MYVGTRNEVGFARHYANLVTVLNSSLDVLGSGVPGATSGVCTFD